MVPPLSSQVVDPPIGQTGRSGGLCNAPASSGYQCQTIETRPLTAATKGDPATNRTGDHRNFWRWLCDELATEADQARDSKGRLPLRPVCLSEVEAVGLMMLAGYAQAQADGGTAGAAGQLADTLRHQLKGPAMRLRPRTPPGGG
jgi:hypothetical protein